MKKERELPRLPLGIHKTYTYIILPLSIGGGAYASYQHLEALRAFSLTGVLDALELVCLLFPFLSVLLDLLSFFPLLSYRRAGRKNAMFTATFKALVAIVSMVSSYLLTGAFLGSAIYLLVAAISLYIYLYYLPKARFFPKGGTSFKALKEAQEESYRVMMEILSKPPQEKEEEVPEEPVEEEETEEEIPVETVPVPPMVRDRSPEADSMRIKKKGIITTGSFYLEEPLFVKEIRLELLDGITGIDFDVYDRSQREYTEAEWLINGKYRYTSVTNFFPGDKTTIRAELTEYEDRMRIELLSVTDTDGNKTEFQRKEETEVYLPQTKLLTAIDSDPAFQTFLKGYVSSFHLNAKYCTTENVKGNALLCPICGTPVLPEDRWCPICGITRDEVLAFKEETILDAYQNPKAEEESEEN